MPRQNFLSTDFFLYASEEDAKRALRSLPQFVTRLAFVADNRLLQSSRFLYEHPKSGALYIDVALLPLNDGHVRITLHGAYANGHAFHKDNYVLSTLKNFEAAMTAAIDGTIEQFVAAEPPASSSTKLVHMLMNGITFFGGSLLSKKLTGGAPF